MPDRATLYRRLCAAIIAGDLGEESALRLWSNFDAAQSPNATHARGEAREALRIELELADSLGIDLCGTAYDAPAFATLAPPAPGVAARFIADQEHAAHVN